MRSNNDIQITIPANTILPLHVRGNYFKLREPIGSTVRLKVKTSAGDEFRVGVGQGQKNISFDILYLQNDTGSDFTCVLMVGEGDFIDDTMTGYVSITPATSFVPSPRLAISGAIQTIAANTSRKKLCIQSDDANTGVIWVGGVVNEGYPMKAGDFLELEITGALDVLGTAATDYLNIWEIE